MATPHVTGGAALLLAQEPDLTPSQVRARLLLTGMSGPVPGDHRVGLNDEDHVLPAGPQAAERGPEEPVKEIDWRARPFPFQNCNLLSKGQNLKSGSSAGSENDADGGEERGEKVEHESPL